MKKLALAFIPVLAVALAAASFLWLFCRIPVPPGYMAIVTKKTGKPLPPGQILAAPGEKGVQRDPLPEGRHFRDPVTHSWRIVPLVSIPVGKVGVVTAKVGKEVPSGQILAAGSDSKGVWKDVLGPGTYRLNPEGYEVTRLDAINIPIGYVGIVTSQTGEPVEPGEFAGPGQQGVMQDVLQPGLYYLNPRAYQVDVLEIGMNQVSINGGSGSVVLTKSQISNASRALDELQATTIQKQQQKRADYIGQNSNLLAQNEVAAALGKGKEILGKALTRKAPASSSSRSKSAPVAESSKRRVPSADDPFAPQVAAEPMQPTAVPESVAFGINRFVEFPSRDGFQILLDMTVEFELLPANISRIYMLYGDLPAVVEKIILPQVLSISRIRGSSYKARDFIDGEGRQLFQKELTAELTRVMADKHIVIHNAIIRHVEVPNEILTPIQESSLAKEQDLTNKARQETARKQAELNTETAMIEQFKKQVEQETEKLVATTVAQTKNEVATIQANTALEVAATNLLKATVQAQITQVQGEAKVKAEYTVANEKALGEQMRAGVFKNSATLAELTFVEALNPEAGIRIIHAGEGTLWTDLKTLAPALPVKK
ncbi:MAG TPA: SPFH domain-containing protein [Kiritimatiellia bacterium]|nr:MAG: SPFH domain / Band 7 family protein [Verrucomicrobia bacterium ADurb.Bin070]HPO36992.1 SPFH domain-containing protein [Kiritimatiellia bacterium]HQA37446.1 SPFH domain-containing protein [Kiritimatiellia bacterium]HQQ91176.1 SPFH domain-containing protein [Kiritimatiellia bacterium]